MGRMALFIWTVAHPSSARGFENVDTKRLHVKFSFGKEMWDVRTNTHSTALMQTHVEAVPSASCCCMKNNSIIPCSSPVSTGERGSASLES